MLSYWGVWRRETGGLGSTRWLFVMLVLALAATACGGGGESEPPASAPADAEEEAPGENGGEGDAATEREASVLRVSSFGGYHDEVVHGLFEQFEEEFNVTIEWEGGSATGNVAKLAATSGNPEWDVIFTEDTNQASASQQGLLAPIDTEIVTNYDDVIEIGKGTAGDGIAYGLNPTAMYYRTDVFEEEGWDPPSDWDDLFRPEFCGRIGMNHPNVTYTLHVAEMLGDGDVVSGIDRLAELAECITVFEPTSPTLEEKVLLGEYVIGTHGQIRLVPMSQEIPLGIVYPESGTKVGMSMASPVAGGPNPEMAQEFLNFFLRPEIQEALVENLAYLPSNTTVDATPDFEGAPSTEAVEQWSIADATVYNENRQAWAEQFDRLIAGN